MLLPILLATIVTTAPDSGATNTTGDAVSTGTPPHKVMSVRIPMPSFITPDEQLKFDIPYQIPELN